MMNTLTRLMVRTYATVKNPGIRGRIALLRKTDPDINLEDVNEFEDLDDLEMDIMKVGESHKQHEREVDVAQKKLKVRITARKYLKEVQPSFLTFAEKQQIKFLHEKYPLEWTPEKLSESFPVLPQGVKSVIRSKWVTTSVDRVVYYDKMVIENWDKFKKGELLVAPKLAEHLKKFIDRKIQPMDRKKIAERIAIPKYEFPKPRSELFVNIVKKYVDENSTEQQTSSRRDKSKLLAATSDESKRHDEIMRLSQSASVSINDKGCDDSKTDLSLTKLSEESRVTIVGANTALNSEVPSEPKKNQKLITGNEFIKQELKRTANTFSVERIVMKDLVRKQIESDIMNDTITCTPSNEPNELSADRVKKQTSTMDTADNSFNDDVEILRNEFKAVHISQKDFANDTSETYVKEWLTKKDEDDYPDFIKIPKSKFKSGMTYRVKDRYYDTDGEFLYRVPGLKD